MPVRRLIQLFRRKKAAARLGIRFDRCSTFHLPEQMVINGRRHQLSLPNENGVKVAFIDLLLDDCYGCKRISEPVKTVLDIGANVGLFGITARLAFPDAVIHAYEPNPNLAPYLQAQAKAARFNYFTEAVGLDNGKVSLDYNEDSVQTRSLTDQSGPITQISFREAINKIGCSVDFVKMDCEGAEWELFRDIESWRRVRHLSMEYHLWPDHAEKEVLDKMRELGFRVVNHAPVVSHPPMEGFGLIIATRST